MSAGEIYAFARRVFFSGADDPDLVDRRFNLPNFGAIAFSGEQAPLGRPIALPSAKGAANGIKRLGKQPVGDELGSTHGLSAKTPLAMALRTRLFCRLHAVPHSLRFQQRIRSIHRSNGFANSPMYENCTLWTLMGSRFENVFFASCQCRFRQTE